MKDGIIYLGKIALREFIANGMWLKTISAVLYSGSSPTPFLMPGLLFFYFSLSKSLQSSNAISGFISSFKSGLEIPVNYFSKL